MKVLRNKTKVIKIGSVHIGGNHPVAIQSMLKVKTADVEAVIAGVSELEKTGCEIVRVAVKDNDDARALKAIKPRIGLPLVADIHFDWRLAIAAIDNGADKIRLNPGNIYRQRELKEIISALKSAKIPLRVGLNSGSIRDSRSRDLGIADRLVASALAYVRRIEKLKFDNLVISLKASNVLDTIEAYRKISVKCDYPLHLGVTAAGLPLQGMVKSSIAIGVLLLQGIGDTIRISLTAHPREEVRVARAVLEVLGLRSFGPQIISCPTCGRCEVDLIKAVNELEAKLLKQDYRPSTQAIKIALMGCVVNGPGEAKEADIGVAFGKKDGLFFKKGKSVKKVSFKECVGVLLREVKSIGA